MKKPKNIRIFGGKRYWLVETFKHKIDAIEAKSRWRNKGYYTRVVSSSGRWVLYVRKGAKPRETVIIL